MTTRGVCLTVFGGALLFVLVGSATPAWAQLGDGFTATAPCVAFDTRSGTQTKFAANETKGFQIVGSGAVFSNQGGESALGCGVPTGTTRAVLINLVALQPSGSGSASIWSQNDTEPNGGVVNYVSTTNSNAVVVGVRQSGTGGDIFVKARTAGVHGRGVVLGYFNDITNITGSQIANGTITGLDIATGTITNSDIASNTIIGADILNNTIQGIDIQDGTIQGIDIATGTITNSDIASNTIIGTDILNGTITRDDIASNTIYDIDMLDEAGAEYAGGNQIVTLTSTDVTVRSVTVTAPTTGYVMVNASAFFFSSGTDGGARCSITTGTTVDFNALIYHQGQSSPFGATRGYSVGSGSTTFRLVCDEFSGNVQIQDSYMTAIFVPTRY